MGVTVPIENFFEANVVGNLASLLGIDPANIRVTFQMRASVGKCPRQNLEVHLTLPSGSIQEEMTFLAPLFLMLVMCEDGKWRALECHLLETEATITIVSSLED